jgi:hypothetical protein
MMSSFVECLDERINADIHSLTCFELANMYFDFEKSIKKLGVSTDNIKGITEFLIYRAYYHANKKSIENNGLTLVNKGYIAGQETDILLKNEDKPLIRIEIKSNYYNIDQDYSRHKQVFDAFPEIKTATIAFEVRKQCHKKKIEKYMRDSDFYQCLVLSESKENFISELSKMKLMI